MCEQYVCCCSSELVHWYTFYHSARSVMPFPAAAAASGASNGLHLANLNSTKKKQVILRFVLFLRSVFSWSDKGALRPAQTPAAAAESGMAQQDRSQACYFVLFFGSCVFYCVILCCAVLFCVVLYLRVLCCVLVVAAREGIPPSLLAEPHRGCGRAG